MKKDVPKGKRKRKPRGEEVDLAHHPTMHTQTQQVPPSIQDDAMEDEDMAKAMEMTPNQRSQRRRGTRIASPLAHHSWISWRSA